MKGVETEELRICCCLSYMRGNELGAFLVTFPVTNMKGVAMLRQVTCGE